LVVASSRHRGLVVASSRHRGLLDKGGLLAVVLGVKAA